MGAGAMSRYGIALDHEDGELEVAKLSHDELEAYATKSGASPPVIDVLRVRKLDGQAALAASVDDDAPDATRVQLAGALSRLRCLEATNSVALAATPDLAVRENERADAAAEAAGLATLDELRGAADAACAEVGEYLAREADVLFLLTGAGFSADSGLAVYADVAKVPAYAKRDLEYSELCEPDWLEKEPDLFWGFWGACFNDYRGTEPHSGYDVLASWRRKRFAASDVADELRALQGPVADATTGPYAVARRAGGFFCFTSNVDAHSYDRFPACEIRDCHGNVEVYQCAAQCDAQPRLWRAPRDWRFRVDLETMLARPGAVDGDAAAPERAATGGAPAVGRVVGAKRTEALSLMPAEASPPDGARTFPPAAYPACPSCGGPARPAILMFGDCAWEDQVDQENRCDAWIGAVEALATQRATTGDVPLRIAVLEIGAGVRVTTIRRQSERCASDFAEAGADVRLIRVNPDFPLADNVLALKERNVRVISVCAKGRDALAKMDAAFAPWHDRRRS